MQRHTILITGAAGYVGAMLCEQFAARPDVDAILALDKELCPDELASIQKISWIQANTADGEEWRERARAFAPSVVIHTAWHIREMYGNRRLQERWNIEGTKRIFEFVATEPCVRKLIHISTAAVYSARPDNSLTHFFSEDEPPRDDEYSYANEKKQSEEDLVSILAEYARDPAHSKAYIVRPSAITGPRGRYLRVRFGLQSALAGHLSGGFLNNIVSLLTIFLPAPSAWTRQFIHEDDVCDSIAHLAFTEQKKPFAIYNITPPGKPLMAHDMATIIGKKVLPVHPLLIRVAFWFFWHATRGRIPTARGVWRFYSYPILLDGTRITDEAGYSYAYSSHDAVAYTDGRYASKIAPSDQAPKPHEERGASR